MPCRRNDAAAVEITALAAGAGPPANNIATRWIGRGGWGGSGVSCDEDDMFGSHAVTLVGRSINPAGGGEGSIRAGRSMTRRTNPFHPGPNAAAPQARRAGPASIHRGVVHRVRLRPVES